MTKQYRIDLEESWIAEAEDSWGKGEVLDWVITRVNKTLRENLQDLFSIKEIVSINRIDFVIDSDGFEH